MEKQLPKGSAAAPSKKRRWSDADQLTRCESDPALDVTTAVGKGSPAISKTRSSASSTSSSSSPQNSANNKKRRNDHTSAVDRDAGQEQRQLLLPQRRGLPIWEGAVPPLAPNVFCCAAPLYLGSSADTRTCPVHHGGHSPAAFNRGGAQQPCRHHRRRDRKRKNHPYARANSVLCGG